MWPVDADLLSGQDPDACTYACTDAELMSPPPIIWDGSPIPSDSIVLGLKHGIVVSNVTPTEEPCMDLSPYNDFTNTGFVPINLDDLGWANINSVSITGAGSFTNAGASTPTFSPTLASWSGTAEATGPGLISVDVRDDFVLYLPVTACKYFTIDFTMSVTANSIVRDPSIDPSRIQTNASLSFLGNSLSISGIPDLEGVTVHNNTGSDTRTIHHEGYINASEGFTTIFAVAFTVQGFAYVDMPGSESEGPQGHAFLDYSATISDFSISLRAAA